MAFWALLVFAAGVLLRASGKHAGVWLFDEDADGIGRLRLATGSVDDAPTFALRRRTCRPFLLVIEAGDVASGRSLRLGVLIDAVPREDFKRLAAWLRRARCAQGAGPE